jgi:poly-gamma-glutamate synthesis protein (capsule biosynthesis protein)
MCHGSQLRAAYDPQSGGYDFQPVFTPVRHLLSEPDLMIVNLETTLPGEEGGYSGYPRFGAPDALAEALKDCGVDVVSVANNHILDKGRDGMRRTIGVLEELGLQPVGAYRSVREWREKRVRLIEVRGIRLAVLAYTYWTNGLPTPAGTVVNRIERERIAEDLRRARAAGPDAVIVYYHFGKEGRRKPSEYQHRWTEFAFEHGADIVFGSHPHVVQGYGRRTVTDRRGVRRECFCAYSLGNFVSGQRRLHASGGIVLRLTLARNPQPWEPQRLLVRKVDCSPVWVDKSWKNGKLHYRVLPVRACLSGECSCRLNPKARERMSRFLRSLRPTLPLGGLARGQSSTDLLPVLPWAAGSAVAPGNVELGRSPD